MGDSNILRKESTRWVASKTSYDGDDWGNEYEEELTPVEPNGPVLEIPDTVPKHSSLEEVQEEEEVEKPTQPTAEPTKETVEDDSKADTTNQSNVTEPTNTSIEHESEADGETSIQEIYGFYEDRTHQHPYSAFLSGVEPMASNEYSDSSASLSTGKFSADSALPDVKTSRKPVEARKNSESNLEKVNEQQDNSEENQVQQDRALPEKLSKLDVNQTHKNDENTHSESDIHPKLEVLENEIAELYQGSSQFLKRPISTYQENQIPSSISDNSIKELLTPLSEQKEFDPPALPVDEENTKDNIYKSESERVPAAVAVPKTEAEPKPEAELKTEKVNEQPHDTSITAPENALGLVDHSKKTASLEHTPATEPNANSETLTSSKKDQVEDKPEVQESEKNSTLGYVDYEVDHQSNTSSSSINQEENGGEVAFTLPSEKNKINHSKNSESLDSKSSGFSNISRSRSRSKSVSSHSSDHSTSSREAPSMASSRITIESEMDQDDEVNGYNSRSSRFSDTISSQTARSSVDDESLQRNLSEAPKESGNDTEDTVISSASAAKSTNESMPYSTAESRRSAPSGTNSIAAKVKRLPQLDFSALMNSTNINSETRTDQLRLLRIRENEYSTGLDAWLATTLIHVNPDMKIYKNGTPPVANGLELDTAAKVSSVMHSSASNTRDKLVQVGEKSKSLGNKSKSFFAKVIR